LRSIIRCDIFLAYLFTFSSKEGTVGTTKLTRKEILAEDPIHNFILHAVEYLRVNGSKAAAMVAVAVVLAFGIYGGIQFIENKKAQAQETFAKGLDYFHADVTPGAPKGGAHPKFQSETEKYQAAAKEFSSVASGRIYGKLSIVARYYLGISQLHLGQKKEAVQNLESVASNSSNRTLGSLAKKALAISNIDSGNYKEAQALLDGMIKDPQCDIQKDELTIQLSRVLVAQGKRDEAIKILREAGGSIPGPSSLRIKPQIMAEMDKLQRLPKSGETTPQAHP
jgi:predicted negative regulator of RcsB-dependent stress response